MARGAPLPFQTGTRAKNPRCQDVIFGTYQCKRDAEVNVRFHALDDNMAFCKPHIEDYTYPDGRLCGHNKGEHVHYDIVPMEEIHGPRNHPAFTLAR